MLPKKLVIPITVKCFHALANPTLGVQDIVFWKNQVKKYWSFSGFFVNFIKELNELLEKSALVLKIGLAINRTGLL